MIGIDTNTHLVYEGESVYGHGVWPVPILTSATLIQKEDDWSRIPKSRQVLDLQTLFREDTFDPVTRIRRGRLYKRAAKETWHVPAHPVASNNRNGMQADGLFHPQLCTYMPDWMQIGHVDLNRILIVLGASGASTVWRVLSVEASAFGEQIFTLRARSTYGTLPEIIEDAIPQEGRREVLALLDRVITAAFRSSAAEISEMCRPAFTVVLREWLRAAGTPPEEVVEKDIGLLLQVLEKRHPAATEYGSIKAVAKIVSIFHSRVKPNEQEKYGTRPISEDDAQMLLQNLGFLLREFNWAKS